MTPQEFVTSVYNLQEGIILDDLYPTDEKYKEVLYQANLVIDEFTKQHDWSWLRARDVLGDTDPLHPHDRTIPKYELSNWVDRVSSLYDDCIKLYAFGHLGCDVSPENVLRHLHEENYIKVPLISKGSVPHRRKFIERVPQLQAKILGRIVTFNRCPHGPERHRAVVAEVQRKLPHIHICNDDCQAEEYTTSSGSKSTTPVYSKNNYHPCKQIEKELFVGCPDTDYFIWKTAYMTSKYSPIAGGIRGELNDTAQKLLSKMRQIDSAKTAPDIVNKSFNYRTRQVW